MRKILNGLLVGFVFIGFLSITGCASTWEGIGKDIEQIGKDIQE